MVLLVLGVLFGLLSTNNATVHSYARVVETDPHLLLFIFLPVLIFESAFGMEVHTFMKTFMQVLLLAIPGLGKFLILLVYSLMSALLQHYWEVKVNMLMITQF